MWYWSLKSFNLPHKVELSTKLPLFQYQKSIAPQDPWGINYWICQLQMLMWRPPYGCSSLQICTSMYPAALYRSWAALSVYLVIVLATGSDNVPEVGDRTGKTVQFGCRPVQKPNPLCLSGLLHGPDIELCVFAQVGMGPWFQPYGSYSFGCNCVFEFWSYYDMMNTQIVQFNALFHLQHSDLRSDR